MNGKGQDIAELHSSLCAELKMLSHYYLSGFPKVSDGTYDCKYRYLQELEQSHIDILNLSTSPTQNVEGSTGTIPHTAPMLSIKNVWDDEQFLLFFKRVSRVSGKNAKLSCEPKFDGIAVSLTYFDGKLIQALTRGDGYFGESILDVARQLKNLPQQINCQGNLTVRGELLIPHDDFETFNSSDRKFANQRNLVSGALRSSIKPNVACLSLIRFYPYGIYGRNEGYHSENMKILKDLGFDVLKEVLLSDNIDELLAYYHERKSKRLSDNFASDGVVFKLDSLSLQEQMGSSTKAPSFLIAYKFPSRSVRTELLDIAYQVGRTGRVTPVAYLDPVHLEGAVVKKASLFNFKFIIDNNVKVGSQVIVKRAGGIIPCIEGCIDTAPNIKALLPATCPFCQSALRQDSKTGWCPFEDCPERQVQSISWMASRNLLNLSGCDTRTARLLMRKKLIRNFFDLYSIKMDDLRSLESFGERKSRNLMDAIDSRRKISLVSALMMLSIPGVSKSGCISLIGVINSDFKKLSELNEDKLSAVSGLGPKKRSIILNHLRKDSTLLTIEKIMSHVQIV